MDDPPPQASFVVRVWAKNVEAPNVDASWRGRVTHIGSGQQGYLEDLMDVPAFLAPHIIELGGALDLRTRLYLWCTGWHDSRDRTV